MAPRPRAKAKQKDDKIAVEELMRSSLSDLQIFYHAAQIKSVRGLARRFEMEPGQISRIIKRLEGRLGLRLVERSASGLVLTQHGSAALAPIQRILAECEGLQGLLQSEAGTRKVILRAIGSSSFMTTKIVAPAIQDVLATSLNTQFRLIDFAPEQIADNALRGACEMAVHQGRFDWPRSWESQKLGSLRWGLFAKTEHKIGRRAEVDAIAQWPFVYPVYWTAIGLEFGDDFCPLKLSKRIKGVATATADAALEVLRVTDNLGFMPELIARSYCNSGALREVKVSGWPVVSKDIYLSFRTDLFSKQQITVIASALAAQL